MASHFMTFLFSWRIILILLFVASLVQVTNILLSWYIQKKTYSKLNEEFSNNYSYIKFNTSFIISSIWKQSILDTSGDYQFALAILKKFILKQIDDSHLTENKHGLTLVTQSSLNLLDCLPELSQQWQGPISVAVFLDDGLEAGVNTLILLNRCFPEIIENITFSFVYPTNMTIFSKTKLSLDTSCNQVLKLLSNGKKPNYASSSVAYPTNLLRNTARKTVTTDYILLLDIDMLPSQGITVAFKELIREDDNLIINDSKVTKSREKIVWVLPAYEIKNGIPFPTDKSSLLDLKNNGFARPFYFQLCDKCQKYTNYEVWEAHSSKQKTLVAKLEPLYEVFWKDPWEPFYISKNDIPFHDERFRQYGFNRISQVCELHISGYRFFVLDSAFVIHKGFKTPGQFHSSKSKEQETNRLLFREFKEDMKKKYPESTKRCY